MIFLRFYEIYQNSRFSLRTFGWQLKLLWQLGGAPPPPGVRARLNTAAGCGSTTLHCIGSYYGLPWCGCHQWYVFHGHNRFLDLINRVHYDNHLYFFTRYRASYVKNAATVEISDCRMSLQSSNATKVIPVKRSWNIMSEVADRVSVGYVPYGRWKECLGRGDLVISLVMEMRISTLILNIMCVYPSILRTKCPILFAPFCSVDISHLKNMTEIKWCRISC